MDETGLKTAIPFSMFSIETAPGQEVFVKLAPEKPWNRHISLEDVTGGFGMELISGGAIHVWIENPFTGKMAKGRRDQWPHRA